MDLVVALVVVAIGIGTVLAVCAAWGRRTVSAYAEQADALRADLRESRREVDGLRREAAALRAELEAVHREADRSWDRRAERRRAAGPEAPGARRG